MKREVAWLLFQSNVGLYQRLLKVY